MNFNLQNRRGFWRTGDLSSIAPIMTYPPTSAQGDAEDDQHIAGKATYFVALAYCGLDSRAEIASNIARLHVDGDGKLHVLLRGKISREIVHFLERGYELVTGRKGSVLFHESDSRTWKAIWAARGFEADMMPMGENPR